MTTQQNQDLEVLRELAAQAHPETAAALWRIEKRLDELGTLKPGSVVAVGLIGNRRPIFPPSVPVRKTQDGSLAPSLPEGWKTELWRYGFINDCFGQMRNGPYVFLDQVESILSGALRSSPAEAVREGGE